ncbi:MAG: glycoside hydrolase family 3 N-terminal domain-containing protein [Verrucomicrobiota bacterium]
MSKEPFLRELMSLMSLEEKLGQLNLLTGTMDATGMKHSGDLAAKIRDGRCGAVLNVYTPAATRALQELALESPRRIPLIFGYDVIHGHRTIFPIPLALSCSWNPDLLERCARAAAEEAAADGLHWVYSPMVDISQDPRWGRVAEGSGEDPWLGSKIAVAMVRGYQGDDLADPAAVVACVKHFALYGAPMGGRDYNTVDMSRRAMEETYFPPYRAAINAGARTVMTAFNEIDGIPASGNRWLLTELLRDIWGFKGWIVTDYTAVTEMKNHGTAANDADAAKQSLDAGVDMDMVSEAFLVELPELVKSGAVSELQIDAAVMRVLETKWDLGLFQDAFARCDEDRANAVHLSGANRQLAREAARESIVLLKNDGGLLPLEKHRTIALIGPLADSRRDMLGCWVAAGDEATAASPLDGIREVSEVIFAKGCEIDSENPQLLAEALRATTQADVILLVLGESWQMSGEAASRTGIRLPKCQRKLAKQILKTGKPCVLVTISGRPLELTWEDSKFHAILHSWALGTEGGRALADVLFGDAPPIGKLTMGFPHSVGQLPMTYREKPTGRPFDEAVQYSSKYLDAGNEALYPFGHGLTYGELEIGAPAVDPPAMKPGATVTVSVQITNPGIHPVTETLQLYLRDLVASVSRPVKELRGYQRVTLDGGEVRTVSFTITDADLSFPGDDFQPVVEAGEFEALIGANSAELSKVRFVRLGD